MATKYLSWKDIDNKDLSELAILGIVSVDIKYELEFSTAESYWSPKYPIALNYYPYNACDVYTDGSSYFFVYSEFGGHGREHRCRFIQKELILDVE